MGAPFEPGDVVVCVDDHPARNRYFWQPGHSPDFPCRKGNLYRIREVALAETGKRGVRLVGVVLGRYHMTGAEYVINPNRFRKLDEDIGFDFREQLRAKPKEPVRAEQPLGTSAGGSVPPFSAPASQHSSTPGVV